MAYMLLHCKLASFSGYSPVTISGNNASVNPTNHFSYLQHEYSEWIVRAKRTLVAVLEDLPSFKPPLDYLLELLPRLQARYYSISSSPKVSSFH